MPEKARNDLIHRVFFRRFSLLASNFFCDYIDDLDYDSPPPVLPDADGRYPAPIPGEWTEI